MSLAAVVAVSCVVGAPAPASAANTDSGRSYPTCNREPTSNDVSAAKGAFEAGQVSFQEADYARAIMYWEDAFRRDCTAVPLLTNLARAYELDGKKQSAIDALEAYLQRRPDSADRPSIEKRIAALRKQLSEEPPPPVAATPVVAADQTPAEEPAPAAEAGPSRPKWPIFLTGSGVVLMALGIPLAIDGQNKVDDFKSKCPPSPIDSSVNICPPGSNFEEQGTQAVNQRNFGIATTVIGSGLAVAGGIVWYMLWSKDGAPAQTAVTPIVSPEYGGLQMSGSF